jgi:hypothetical protein
MTAAESELARLNADLLKARRYRPKIRYKPNRPRPRQQPEYRYIVETGCMNLQSCDEDCSTCSKESQARWVIVSRLTQVYQPPEVSA